MDLLVAP